MSVNLKKFLSRLAIDPDRYSEFVADPKTAASKCGLSAEDQAVLLSGDQNRIYLALQSQNKNGKA